MVNRHGVAAVIPALLADGAASLCQRWLGQAPLLAYTIAAAKQCPRISQVWVATDDPSAAILAEEWGARVFITPAYTRVEPVRIVRTLLDDHAQEISPEDTVVWLPVSAPLRPRHLIEQAVSLLDAHPETGRLVTVCESSARKTAYVPSADHRIEILDGSIWLESGHLTAYQSAASLVNLSAQAEPSLPLAVNEEFCVNLASPLGWARAEWLLRQALPELIYPLHTPRPLPEKVGLLVMDFDGVITDNRVFVDENGGERVAAYRSDSLGLRYLQQTGVPSVVLSTETNAVVAARCKKMRIPFRQGVNDKPSALREWTSELGVALEDVVYLGNDLNDVPCFPLVGCAVVPADAEPGAKREADLILDRKGGYGAVRELCDLLIQRAEKSNKG